METTPAGCTLAKRFSVREKVWAQLSFQVMAVAAIVGIARVSWPWAVPYAVLYGYVLPGIVMRHVVCPRCPHLFVYDDCLQLPTSWTKWIVKQRRTTPWSAPERWTFYATLLLFPAYPVYWLGSQPILLTVFALSALAWYLGQWLHFCRRCRNSACPGVLSKVSWV